MWGRLPSIANTTPQKYIFLSKTPLFYQNIYYFCLVSATESLTFLGRSVVPGRIGLHLRGLRSILATRNGTATPSYKKHSSIAPNP